MSRVFGRLVVRSYVCSEQEAPCSPWPMIRSPTTVLIENAIQVTMLERSLELALALEHLHYHMPEMFIVHRDLKPDNVGFKADGTLKLVSFLLTTSSSSMLLLLLCNNGCGCCCHCRRCCVW